MRAAFLIVPSLLLCSCSLFRSARPAAVHVDTVVVTREVQPALPTGDSVEICLATGRPAQVLVAADGDTLVGPDRVRLAAVRPLLDFAGTYAADLDWFERTDTIRFEKRVYRKLGRPQKRSCDELKRVGDFSGIPVFAEITAPQPLPGIEIPVRPGVFQSYVTPVPRRRR